MIGYFPHAYPDELFYSICSRFSHRMRFPSTTSTKAALCMSIYSTTGIYLPQNLEALATSLPPGHPCKADVLIDEHTMLPFFAAFVSDDEYSLIRASMKYGGDKVHRVTGIIRPYLRWPMWTMRYCPACVVADRRAFGEAYWHRVHQIRGVEICPRHFCFLSVDDCNPRDEFISAKSRSLETQPRKIDPCNPACSLACEIDSLLSNSTGQTRGADWARRLLLKVQTAEPGNCRQNSIEPD